MREQTTRSSVRVSIPRSLYQQILQIQVNGGLDFNEAASKAATLIQPNGELFQEAVRKAAQELGQSQFLKQLNTSRTSIREAAFTEGIEHVRCHEVNFSAPCSKCGKPTMFTNRDPNWGKIKSILYEAFKGWAHVTCPT